jgi:hypothetical protein
MIPPISTKRTINSHLNSLTQHDFGNPGSGFGQANICGGIVPVNGNLPLLIYTNDKKPPQICFHLKSPRVVTKNITTKI